jgi:hypothetical protein
MNLLRVSVKPEKNGTVTVRLQARDDTGRYIEKWASSPNSASVPAVIQATLRDLQVAAAESTEEEGYEEKLKK